ncbi:MAG: ECF-type sigma factor, partial [Pirellula sp.]
MSGSDAEKGSVSGWIELLRLGRSDAIEPLLERYFKRLASFADRKLRDGIRTSDDGEDIALQVLQSVVEKIGIGNYPELTDRNDLWLLLMVAAHRRVIDQQRRELRWEQLFAPVRTITDLMESWNNDLDGYLSQDDAQQKALELIDFWDHMINKIAEPVHREIAKLKLEGYTNREIAVKLEFTPKRVDRVVAGIIARWKEILEQDS